MIVKVGKISDFSFLGDIINIILYEYLSGPMYGYF